MEKTIILYKVILVNLCNSAPARNKTYFLPTNRPKAIVVSSLLSLCTFLRCLSFYWMVRVESYEVVEGVCIELGCLGLRKRRRVRLLQEDGDEYAILLDKRTPLRIGNRYRIFFRCEDDGGQAAGLLPFFAVEDQLLGLEDMGEYHAAASSKNDKEDALNV